MQIPQKIAKLITPLSCFTIFIWAMYIRFKRLAGRELWKDEIHQFKNFEGSFKSLWKQHGFGDFSCFQGDYLLTFPFVQYFGQNKWGLAIPHIIATVVGFYLLYRICQHYFKSALGYVITFFIVCFNASLIYHAFEFRPYAVLPTMALAGFLIIINLFNKYPETSLLGKVGSALILMLILWFNMGGVLMILSLGFYFVLDKMSDKTTRAQCMRPLKFLLIVIVLALPLWYFYASCDQPNFRRAGLISGGIHTFDFIPNPLIDLVGFLKGVFGNLIGKRIFYPLLGVMLLSFALPHRDRMRQIGFFLAVIILPLEVQLLSCTIKGYWFIQRQFVWVMPLFAFLLGWCCDSLYCLCSKKEHSQRFLST